MIQPTCISIADLEDLFRMKAAVESLTKELRTIQSERELKLSVWEAWDECADRGWGCKRNEATKTIYHFCPTHQPMRQTIGALRILPAEPSIDHVIGRLEEALRRSGDEQAEEPIEKFSDGSDSAARPT